MFKIRAFRPDVKDKRMVPFSAARSIGVIYDTEKVSSKMMNSITHHFESAGKKVHSIGFVNKKEIRLFTPNFKESYFCLEDLDFWGLPKQDKIERFCTTEFDYLINLDTEGDLRLQAIAAQSMARIRIGKHIEGFTFAHDFMIKSDATDGAQLFEDLKAHIR